MGTSSAEAQLRRLRRQDGRGEDLRILTIIIVIALGAGCPGRDDDGGSEGEGEGEGETSLTLGLPKRVDCNCADGTTFQACAVANACEQGRSVQCDAVCADHQGLVGMSCPPGADVGCLLGGSEGGGNGVLCPCYGFDERDGGGCTSLDCDADADAIADVCAAFCPTSTEALCAPSASCESGGPAPGRDLVECECSDGSRQRGCTSGICGSSGDRLNAACTSICGDGGLAVPVSCESTNIACALGDEDGSGGDNGVSCNCIDAGNLGACTTLDCGDDAAAIQSACDNACSRRTSVPVLSSPVCVADESCAAGNAPLGGDFSFCHCADDVFFTFCSAGCLSCEGVCDDHGGLSDGLVEGCSQSELGCVAGAPGGDGGPNAIGCRCDGDGEFITRCGDVDCNDLDALEASCTQACFGASAEATCVAADVGCVAGAPPSGPSLSDCTCGDGTHATACVADCRDDIRLVLPCFAACRDRGGFASYDCSPNAECQ